MTTEKMFEVAVRTKMRFPFKGMISVEDLWDLSEQNLDVVFKKLNSQLKQVQEESLLNTKTKENEELEIKIEVVKHIVAVKIEEKQLKENEKTQKEQKQQILKALASKQNENLQNKSEEELKSMLEELNNPKNN